jgi:hypothetical protein
MFSSKKKSDDKPKIKLKVSRPSGTYCEGETIEGKILVTGIRRKLNSLSIHASGACAPSSSQKMVEAVPQLAKIQRINLFEFEKTLVTDYTVSGSIKKSFKFELKSTFGKSLFETYYGYMFATKYLVLAKCRVDDAQEGQAKVEIQLRCYVETLNAGQRSSGKNARLTRLREPSRSQRIQGGGQHR